MNLFRKKLGSAIVEMATVAVLAVPLFALSQQVWFTLSYYDKLEFAACMGARYASLQDPPLSNIQNMTNLHLKNAVLPTTPLKPQIPNMTVTVNFAKDVTSGTTLDFDGIPGTGPGQDGSLGTVEQGDVLSVNIALPVNGPGQFRSFLINGGQPTTITRSCTYSHLLID